LQPTNSDHTTTHHKHTIDLNHFLLYFQLLNATKLIYRKLKLWFIHLQKLHNAYGVYCFFICKSCTMHMPRNLWGWFVKHNNKCTSWYRLNFIHRPLSTKLDKFKTICLTYKELVNIPSNPQTNVQKYHKPHKCKTMFLGIPLKLLDSKSGAKPKP
jgi:hypothetical protein